MPRARFFAAELTLLCALSAQLLTAQAPGKVDVAPPLSNGQIVHAERAGAVYLVRNGQKCLILDPAWILRHGYHWEDVRSVPPAVLNGIPNGPDILDPPSTLEHQLVRSAGDGKIYVVSGGIKRWLLNPNWAAANGYRWEDLKTVSGAELDGLPSGEPITYETTEALASRARTRALWLTLLLALVGAGLLALASGIWPSRAPSWSGWRAARKIAGARWFWLAVFCALAFARAPALFAHPRFWAEEGTVWFQYALDHSPWATLVYTFPDSGYLNLLANLGAILAAATARAIGPESAPLATTWLAAAIQAACFGLVLYSNSKFFRPLWKRVCACCIVLFAVPESGEIWLNTINSMSYLGLLALLLLLADPEAWPRWMKWTARGLLVLCGLSGPYAIFLLPAFFLCLLFDRRRERVIHAALLTACLVVQGGVILANRLSGQFPSTRLSHFAPSVALINALHLEILNPVLGKALAEGFGAIFGLHAAWYYAAGFPRPAGQNIVVAAWFSFLVLASALVYLLRGATSMYPRLIACAFTALAVGTAAGSLYSIPGGRYAYLPGVVFVLLLLASLDRARQLRSIAASILIAASVSAGALDYTRIRTQWGAAPAWSDEVRLWRESNQHLLRISPPFWQPTVNLRSLAPPPAAATPAPSVPTSVSLTPSSGAGRTASFAASYEALGGVDTLTFAHLLINTEPSGPGACWTYYKPTDGTLWLVNDTQTATLGPLKPGSPGALQNSQCVLDAAASSVRRSGNILVLQLHLTFKPAFAGQKTSYLNVQDASSMCNWKPMGVWTIPK